MWSPAATGRRLTPSWARPIGRATRSSWPSSRAPEDVEPGRYRAAPHPKLGETDRARDAVELALIAGAERRRLPILAICRGIQILNVALGGTLYQRSEERRVGKECRSRWSPYH